MVKTVFIRTISRRSAVAAVSIWLGACAPTLPSDQGVPPVPPGPTPAEVAEYATAQMHYRFGLATGNDDVVVAASRAFRQIPREIFFRQDPRLFAAVLVCERYQVPGPAADGRSPPSLFDPQCQGIEWRYETATNAIRRDLQARIAASDFATIAQAGGTRRP